MAYFDELPNIFHPSLLPSSNKVEDRIAVKNIFKRSKLRSDVDQVITVFNYYYVRENYRPDMVAEEIYEDPELDWIILTTNNIINIRDQWPLNHNDLYNHIVEKYGSEANTLGIHHYETKEMVDEYNRTVIPAGLQVDANFTFQYKNYSNSMVIVNPVVSVTNYEYETKLNEEKRKIKVLKSQYLSIFITDHQNIMNYKESSDYITNRLKGTHNPRTSGI